ncbi:MAG: alpha/beta hydrolase [Eubacteriales bacterium]
MKKENIKIEGIPAVIWGEECGNVIIAVHGSMSNKNDVPIDILAHRTFSAGYQTLSFDLPEHGDRKDESVPFKARECVCDLKKVMEYAKKRWRNISLFSVSIGAYFSLIAYENEELEKAFFLSPVVDMRKMIEGLMAESGVSEEALLCKGEIPTSSGPTLYADYYLYVKDHPIEKWDTPTFILYGNRDNVSGKDTVYGFAEKFSCKINTVSAEHYFHTEKDLSCLDECICDFFVNTAEK